MSKNWSYSSEFPLVDTYCHLDFEQFNQDRDEVLERAAKTNIKRIVVPAIDLDSCLKVIRLAERYDAVYAAVGVHPNSSAGWRQDWIDLLREYCQHEKVVAIGEIGLDYFRESSPKSTQKRALLAQIGLAAEMNLPVILHNREANADLLRLLHDSPLNDNVRPGVFHSFLTDWKTAEKALSMGYYLGFTGPVTYKKADALRSVVSKVPSNRLLVETDAPFLAPQKYRGKRNEPSYVNEIANTIAEIQGVSRDEFARQTTENAISLFGQKLDHE